MIGALRRWARGHTRERVYSPVGVAFHWVMAALVFAQMLLGWRAGQAPVGGEKLAAYELHVNVGLVLLILVLLRMGWRLMIPGPVNDADKPGVQSKAAHLTHYIFYICLIGLPLTGWAMLSATAESYPLTAGGVLPWPFLPFQDLAVVTRWRIEMWAERLHFGFILTLLALIPMHVGAALYHHLLHHDDVLPGMIPGLEHAEAALRKGWRRTLKALRSLPASAAD